MKTDDVQIYITITREELQSLQAHYEKAPDNELLAVQLISHIITETEDKFQSLDENQK